MWNGWMDGRLRFHTFFGSSGGRASIFLVAPGAFRRGVIHHHQPFRRHGVEGIFSPAKKKCVFWPPFCDPRRRRPELPTIHPGLRARAQSSPSGAVVCD